MTLSDVIDTLQTWIRNADDEYDREEMGRVAGLKEALHEIKKIEPCEDAISRKEAINVVHYYFQHYLDVNDDICLDGIRTLPSVTSQRKRGKWLWELAPNGWANHICSECGFKENTDIHVKLNWQFCPNCGTRMIEIKKSEDKE